MPRIPISEQSSSFWRSFSFHGEYFYSPKELRCQNPRCHAPIKHVFIIRNKKTGEVMKLGPVCFQRWLRACGFSTDPWFELYLARLKKASRINPKQAKILRKDFRETLEREDFKRILIPKDNFSSWKEAENWARSQGGYCLGTIEKIETYRDVKCLRGHHIFYFFDPKQREIVEIERSFFENMISRFKCRKCGQPPNPRILSVKYYWEIYLPSR